MIGPYGSIATEDTVSVTTEDSAVLLIEGTLDITGVVLDPVLAQTLSALDALGLLCNSTT